MRILKYPEEEFIGFCNRSYIYWLAKKYSHMKKGSLALFFRIKDYEKAYY